MDRHGPIDHRSDKHHRTKSAGFDGQTLGAQLRDDLQIQTLRIFWVGSLIERRTAAAADIAKERELGHDQHCAMDVADGQRHASVLVWKDSQTCDLIGDILHVLGFVGLSRPEVDQQTAPDRADHLAADGDACFADPLNDGAHASWPSTGRIVLPNGIDVQYCAAMKPVVGLTGGIACGKTTVAEMFEELGIPVIDADELAREVVEPGTPGLKQITDAFGQGVLDARGGLDRKKLGDVVFGDEEARKTLNAIMHPLIEDAGAERIESCEDDPAPYIIYEAALLVETNTHDAFSALIVVSADESLQRLRLIARDGFTVEEANARIASQLPLAGKIAVADYVVTNNGDLDATRKQVADIHEKLTAELSGQEST